ncbi:protein of unknown function [Streptomyces murinus]
MNRLLWMQDRFGLAADDRVLQKTPSGFDVSVWEFFWPLVVGAGLVVARPGGHRDPAYVAEVIAEQRVTTVHFVPSMLQVFLQEPAAARCAGLRRGWCAVVRHCPGGGGAVPAGPGRAAVQSLRPYGSVGGRVLVGVPGPARGGGADRATGLEHPAVRAGRGPGPGAGGCRG